jgi:hypothetical protein
MNIGAMFLPHLLNQLTSPMVWIWSPFKLRSSNTTTCGISPAAILRFYAAVQVRRAISQGHASGEVRVLSAPVCARLLAAVQPHPHGSAKILPCAPGQRGSA